MNSSRISVIAYGNPLRCDDGVAWWAAGELNKKVTSPNVEILQVQQLVPELAEKVSRSQTVIFVDAAAADPASSRLPGEIRIAEITDNDIARAASSAFHHQYSPASLLRLAAQLYAARPRAFIASLAGQDFSPGGHLSPTVERALPQFVAAIGKQIRELTRASMMARFESEESR
jgi:hydrogenase maturation protease